MSNRTVTAVVGVFAISALFVFGMVTTGGVDDPAPLISTVLGFGTMIGVQMMGQVKTEQKLEKVEQALNGEMDAKIQTNVHQVLDERNVGDAPTNTVELGGQTFSHEQWTAIQTYLAGQRRDPDFGTQITPE